MRALSPVEPELRPRRRAVARWGGALGAAAFYATAAVLLTWPLFRRPASTVVSAAADVLLTVWILAWDVHAAAGTEPSFFSNASVRALTICERESSRAGTRRKALSRSSFGDT